MKKPKIKKIKIKPKHYILILAIIIPISFLGLISFSLYGQNTAYISATDILKNFKFESIDGEPIINDGAFNNKLRFDTQSSWILYPEDVNYLYSFEDGDSTKLKYRVTLRNKINIYTNVKISQMSQKMQHIDEQFLGVKYKHYALGGITSDQWTAYIEWSHWDFGDIRNWNDQNNVFSGRIVMSFDIDDNPIPDTFGAHTETEYAYIAVSEAGIVTNDYGKMSNDMPTIINLSPSESKTPEKSDETFNQGQTADDGKYLIKINPDVKLTVISTPTESWGEAIRPDTAGSSMNPTNKDGTSIWDPQNQEKSMKDAKIHYDLGSLSPMVYRYEGKMTYTEYDLLTEAFLTDNIWDWFATEVRQNHLYDWDREATRDVALHGINRYIQVDMMVAFDIWSSVKVGTLTPLYESLRLEKPSEYYDELIWSTLAGGWTGSTIDQSAPSQGIDIFSGFFDLFGGIINFIVIIVIAVVGLYLFIQIGVPSLARRALKKRLLKRN